MDYKERLAKSIATELCSETKKGGLSLASMLGGLDE